MNDSVPPLSQRDEIITGDIPLYESIYAAGPAIKGH
jgi:hypothetical protein